MDNKALWNRVCMTDPKAVKPITGKDYGGNSPKPYWIIERLTDEFGPCGIGWGYSIDSERFERFSDTDTLHIAQVTLWYDHEGKRGTVTQMGQTKATYMTGSNKFKVDEDAPKKSVTDALVKCASYLGFAGDIFSGRWDDSKYVAEANREWRAREAGEEPPQDIDAALSNPLGMFPPKTQTVIRRAAAAAIEAFNEGKEFGAYEEVVSCIDKYAGDDSDKRNQLSLAFNTIFKPHSALRAALKRISQDAHKETT